MKKLTLTNRKTFFSKIRTGEEFSYSKSFLFSEVKELGLKYRFKIISIDCDTTCQALLISHYDYLTCVLPIIFESLSKETNNPNLTWDYYGGIISAHGDKFYSYEDIFIKNGLTFFQGVAIGLLSYINPYAKECRETKEGFIPVEQWIIKNKDKFLPIILDAEKNFFSVGERNY